MQPDHVSTQYITSSPQCQQTCSRIHPSQKRHQTISTQDLQGQIEQILGQNFDKWLGLFEKLQNTLQDLIQNVSQYLGDLETTFNEYRNIFILNQHKLSEKDQNTLATAVSKVTRFNYEKLTCDEVDRIQKAIQQNTQKQKLALNEQFQKVQQKIGTDLFNILNKSFPYVNKKSSQNVISPDEISNKIKEIMQQQILKIKPLINEQLSKVKSPTKVQQTQTPTPKTDIWVQMAGQNKQQQSSRSIKQSKVQQPKNQKPTITKERIIETFKTKQKPDDTKSITSYSDNNSVKISKLSHVREKLGKFNCAVKVLFLIKKQMNFNGKTCTRFLAGDQTGAAVFMLEKSSLIELGHTIQIKSAQIANFDHEKQVQLTSNTNISISMENIRQIGSFRLSQTVTKIYSQNASQIQKLFAHMRYRQQQTLIGQNTKSDQKQKPQYVQKPQQNLKQSKATYVPKAQNKNQPKRTQPAKQSPASTYKKVKISQIQPGQKGYWVSGQVLKVIQTDGEKKLFTLGDETGIIDCQVPICFKKFVRQGVLADIQYADAIYEKGYYVLKLSAKGRVSTGSEAPPSINRTKNKAIWQPSERQVLQGYTFYK